MTLPATRLPPLGPFSFLDMLDRIERVACEQTEHQDVAIVDHEELGRVLFLDETMQSAAVDERRYHEFLIHPAVALQRNVSSVLVGGAGEGASLRELLRHESIQRIVAVDIDRRLVELAREHLPGWHEGAFDDPRVELRIESIIDTVAATPDCEHDLVVLDLTDPTQEDDDIAFLDDAFFEQLRRVLGPSGLLVMQFGELHAEVAHQTRAAADRLRRVFPWVDFGALSMASFGTTWSFAFAASTQRELVPVDLEDRQFDELELTSYDARSHEAFGELALGSRQGRFGLR